MAHLHAHVEGGVVQGCEDEWGGGGALKEGAKVIRDICKRAKQLQREGGH